MTIKVNSHKLDHHPPFAEGNTLGVKHGAYGTVVLAPRAAEIADGLREAMISEELHRPIFEPAIRACALVLARVERASVALDAAEEDPEIGLDMHMRLREDLRKWTNSARGYLSDLGLTPSALARISRDTGVGKAARATSALRELNAHLEREHGENET